jgi:acyl CoA:acetate/3-ketoacid CoA transferase beta subunit
VDLVSDARKVMVAMVHTARGGRPQDRPALHPAADRDPSGEPLIVVIEPTEAGLVRERRPGVSTREIEDVTAARLIIDPKTPEMRLH